MKIDRDLQKKILLALEGLYPNGAKRSELRRMLDDVSSEELLRNLIYLEQHQLVVSGFKYHSSMAGDEWVQLGPSMITAAGLDFIADDGGLTAIFKTMTVRLDAGQFAKLLAIKLENLPGVAPEERSELAKAIRRMPATAIEKLTEKMLDWTVDHAGDALPLIRAAIAMAT